MGSSHVIYFVAEDCLSQKTFVKNMAGIKLVELASKKEVINYLNNSINDNRCS
jgi:hypothetical protein